MGSFLSHHEQLHFEGRYAIAILQHQWEIQSNRPNESVTSHPYRDIESHTWRTQLIIRLRFQHSLLPKIQYKIPNAE